MISRHRSQHQSESGSEYPNPFYLLPCVAVAVAVTVAEVIQRHAKLGKQAKRKTVFSLKELCRAWARALARAMAMAMAKAIDCG